MDQPESKTETRLEADLHDIQRCGCRYCRDERRVQYEQRRDEHREEQRYEGRR